MFIGRYYHTLEQNGRLALPKNFRKDSSTWIVTRGLDGGLFMFVPETFEKQLSELSERTFTKKRNRDFIRLMVNNAEEVEHDALGRVVLPKYLTEQAALKKNVVISGSYSYLEIWDRDRYHAYLDNLEPQLEEIAEQLEVER